VTTGAGAATTIGVGAATTTGAGAAIAVFLSKFNFSAKICNYFLPNVLFIGCFLHGDIFDKIFISFFIGILAIAVV